MNGLTTMLAQTLPPMPPAMPAALDGFVTARAVMLRDLTQHLGDATDVGAALAATPLPEVVEDVPDRLVVRHEAGQRGDRVDGAP